MKNSLLSYPNQKNLILQRQRQGRSLMIHVFFLVLLLLPLAGCGSASPQAGIPAPVSQAIAVSNLGGGATGVAGAPGAVQGGATVNIVNATQSAFSQNAFPWLVGVAYAQDLPVEVSVLANDDGSFDPITIVGSTNDVVQVTQEIDGQVSEPASFQVPPENTANQQGTFPPQQ